MKFAAVMLLFGVSVAQIHLGCEPDIFVETFPYIGCWMKVDYDNCPDGWCPYHSYDYDKYICRSPPGVPGPYSYEDTCPATGEVTSDTDDGTTPDGFDGCFVEGWAFDASVPTAAVHSDVRSPVTCQQLCQENDACEWFHWEANGKCVLKRDWGVQVQSPGSYRGVKYCPEETTSTTGSSSTSDDDSEEGGVVDTATPGIEECFFNDRAMDNVAAMTWSSGISSPWDCQSLCASDDNCLWFQWEENKKCSLYNWSSEPPMVVSQGTIVGPYECPDTDTTSGAPTGGSSDSTTSWSI